MELQPSSYIQKISMMPGRTQASEILRSLGLQWPYNPHGNILQHLEGNNPTCSPHHPLIRHHDPSHQHNKRKASSFAIPPYHEKKPSYKGGIYFNHLPNHLRREADKTFIKELSKRDLSPTYLIDQLLKF